MPFLTKFYQIKCYELQIKSQNGMVMIWNWNDLEVGRISDGTGMDMGRTRKVMEYRIPLNGWLQEIFY